VPKGGGGRLCQGMTVSRLCQGMTVSRLCQGMAVSIAAAMCAMMPAPQQSCLQPLTGLIYDRVCINLHPDFICFGKSTVCVVHLSHPVCFLETNISQVDYLITGTGSSLWSCNDDIGEQVCLCVPFRFFWPNSSCGKIWLDCLGSCAHFTTRYGLVSPA